MHRLIFLLLLITLSFSSSSIYINNRTINAITYYKISLLITKSTTIQTGKLTIQFPSPGFTNSLLSSSSCSSQTCSVSSLNITIPNFSMTANQDTIQITINSITNPGSTLASSNRTVLVLIETNKRNYSTTSTLGVFDAGVLESCEIIFWNNTVNTNTTGQLEIKTKNKLSNGKISLTIPSYWNYSVDDTVRILNNATRCDNSGTLLNCSFTDFWATSYLEIKNLTISSGASYKLNISNFVTPPVSALNTQLSASTSDIYSNLVDGSVSCRILALTAKTTVLASVVPTGVIESELIPIISFLNPDPITAGDVLQVTVSSLMTVVNLSSLTFNISSKNDTFPLIISTTYKYTIQFDSSSPTLTSLNQIILSSLKFKLIPYSKLITNAITFTLSRNGYNYMLLQVDIKVMSKTLTTKSIATTQSVVQKPATFTVAFVSLTGLVQSSSFIITLPTELSSIACVNSLTINTSTYTTVNCNYQSQVITITNLPITIPSNSSISIKFNATNPLTTQPISLKLITIYNNSLYNSTSQQGISDTATFDYTPTSAAPGSVTITPTSYKIGDRSKYTISYRTSSLLPVNSSIIISIPQQILANNVTSVSISLNNVPILTITYTIIFQVLTFTNLNPSISIPSSSLLTISLDSLTNPHNFSTTTSFTLTSISTNNYLIQQISSYLTITMNTSTVFNSVNVILDGKKNGELTVYTFVINSNVNVRSGYVMVVIVPESVGMGDVQCVTNQMVCQKSGRNLSILINMDIGYNETKTISVSGFTNPRTFDSTGTFRFYLYNGINLYQQSDFSGFSNTQPNDIISFTKTLVTPSQSYLNSTQSIKFSVKTFNRFSMIDNQYFELTMPDSFSIVSGSSVNCDPNYLCSISSKSNKIITVRSSTPSGTTFEFVINNLRTPVSLQSMQNSTNQYFTISSYTSNNTIIDATLNNIGVPFELSCNVSCQTCDIGNTSHCLSCYSNSTLFGTQCLDCEPGYYKNSSSNQCEVCSSNCKTCVVTSARCTSCPTDFFLNTLTSICVSGSNCPLRTYPHLGQCLNCSATCLSCENTSSTCITCADTYYKRTKTSSQCVLQCDSGLLKFDGICQCSNCLTCSNIITNCTSCDIESLNKYLHNNLCLEKCPPTTYGSGSTCLRCMEGCNVCSATQCFDQVENSLTGKLIPVPFTLAIIIVIIISVMSKVIFSQTHIPSFLVAVGGVLEILCWVVLLGIMRYFQTTKYRTIGQILIASGIGLNYLLNISHGVIFWKYLMGDKGFSFWFRRQTSRCNKIVTIIFSCITSHRYSHILFSRLFNSQNLKGCLENPINMVPIYINTGLSFVGELLVIAGCGVIAYDPRTYSRGQLYMQCIDSIIINILTIIFTSWNFIKPDGFFKPVEINKYHMREQFKNNQTIESLNDNYLENMQIEEVVGMTGGRVKYKNTRLHLEGLDEKALGKRRERVVAGLVAEIVGLQVGLGEDAVMESRLIKKVGAKGGRVNNQKKRRIRGKKIILEGISESSEGQLDQMEIDGEQYNEEQDEEYHNVENRKEQTKRGKELDNQGIKGYQRQGIDFIQSESQLSMSKDSLIRYQNPLDIEQADIIFASKQIKPNAYSSNNNPNKHSQLNNNQQKNLKMNQFQQNEEQDFNQQNSKQQQQEYYYNQYGQLVNQNGILVDQQSLYNPNSKYNFDHESVPQHPAIYSQSQDYSTNFDHLNSQSSNFPIVAYQTSYSPKGIKKSLPFKRLDRIRASFNRTQGGKDGKFFKKKGSFDSEERYSQQPPIFNSYSNQKLQQKKQLNKNSNGVKQVPYHQFQRYLDDDIVTNFQQRSSVNQISKKRQVNSSSVGSIRRTKNQSINNLNPTSTLTQQDISRQVISQSILAPQTPIRIPRIQQIHLSNLHQQQNNNNYGSSVTEHLSTITENTGRFGSVKKERAQLPIKLTGTSKIYMQKLRVSESQSKGKKQEK